VRRRNPTLRAITLLGAGSAAVHELRYAIGFGTSAPHALAAHPHGYLSVALPGILTATLIALASVAMRAAGARRESVPQRVPLVALWLACTTVLAAIFAVQETLEGAGAIANGGWIGLALAVPAGLLVALALRGADAVEALRTRGAALLGFAVAAAVPVPAALTFFARLTPVRCGARAPPPAFVV
jgi:hypothetical protein